MSGSCQKSYHLLNLVVTDCLSLLPIGSYKTAIFVFYKLMNFYAVAKFLDQILSKQELG